MVLGAKVSTDVKRLLDDIKDHLDDGGDKKVSPSTL